MRRLTVVLLLFAAGAFAPAAQAAPCFTTMSVDAVRSATDGATFEATGKTVSSGNSIDDFPVTILGVLDDGIGIGHDMIIAEVHDYPALNNDRVKGIWAGMSGSPVYDAGGDLIGSISFGLGTGASPIAGITPADDMVDVLERPAAPASPLSARVTSALQHKMVATGAVTARQAASGMDQLRIPLAVSGLNANRLAKFAARLPGSDRFIPYHAGAAAASAGPGDPALIQPGSNFATALSYGDVAAAGVGTTTARCGDSVIAFGHPMNFDGPTSLSVHNATAIVIQDDLIAPFKVANIGGLVGTLDQDRMTGIRGLLGAAPTPVVVTSRITDDGGAPDAGETDVNRTNDTPDLATAHLLSSVDSAIDRLGAGRMSLGWTVTGTAGGQPFSLTRNNRFADSSDISFASTDEMFGYLATIVQNPFTAVKLNTIDMTAAVQSQFRQYLIKGLEQFNGTTWVPVTSNDTITLTPGETLRVRVLLENYRNSTPVPPVKLSFPIADDASGDGSLDITGGTDGGGDTGGGSGSGSNDTGPTTFKDLLKALNDFPRNDDLTGSLSMFATGGAPASQPGTGLLDTATPGPQIVKQQVAEVVSGTLSIPVTVGEPEPSPGPDLNVTGKASAPLATSLKKGLQLTVRSSAPGRLVVKVTVDKKTARRLHLKKNAKAPVVVAALTKVIGDGRSRVTVKFTKAAKRHLKHAKRVKLAIKATITDLDGNRTTDRAKMTLTRKSH